MLSLITTKGPAFAGVRAVPSASVPAPPGIARAILATCGVDGSVAMRTSALPEPQGYYLVSPRPAFGHEIFVKILPLGECDRQVRGDKFARHVASHAIPASVLLPGFPVEFGPSLGLLAYEAIEGRYSLDTEDDVRRVGGLLAKVHRALRAIGKEQADGETTTRQRLHRLSRNLPELTRRFDVVGLATAPPAWDIEKVFQSGLGEPQITHGDANHGNILFPIGGGEPVLLDYEDAATSWFPPLVDIVFAAERFALAGRNDQPAERLCNALFAGYEQESRRPVFPAVGAFQLTLESLALRSLLSVIEVAKTGAEMTSEWEKFVCLLQEARRRSGLLKKIESAHVAD